MNKQYGVIQCEMKIVVDLGGLIGRRIFLQFESTV